MIHPFFPVRFYHCRSTVFIVLQGQVQQYRARKSNAPSEILHNTGTALDSRPCARFHVALRVDEHNDIPRVQDIPIYSQLFIPTASVARRYLPRGRRPTRTISQRAEESRRPKPGCEFQHAGFSRDTTRVPFVSSWLPAAAVLSATSSFLPLNFGQPFLAA